MKGRSAYVTPSPHARLMVSYNSSEMGRKKKRGSQRNSSRRKLSEGTKNLGQTSSSNIFSLPSRPTRSVQQTLCCFGALCREKLAKYYQDIALFLLEQLVEAIRRGVTVNQVRLPGRYPKLPSSKPCVKIHSIVLSRRVESTACKSRSGYCAVRKDALGKV